MIRIESQVVTDGINTWKVSVRYAIKPFGGRDVFAKRVLDSIEVAGK